MAASEIFGNSPDYWGFEINPDYIKAARDALKSTELPSTTIQKRNFYDINWKQFLGERATPILIIGNPPWITNAGMGVIKGKNLPEKSNFQGHGGFAAKTGKANFDISEWMLIRLLEASQGSKVTIAMLCKTATARKVLRHAWVNGLDVGPSSVHIIDATKEFGVAVDACLLYTHTGTASPDCTATLYGGLSFDEPLRTFGLVNGELVSDIHAYQASIAIEGLELRKWRSGIKHDAAKVMEFTLTDGVYVNGFGERCDLEDDYLFPLLKSSDIANGRLKPTRYVLVTQRRVSDPTSNIKTTAPKTWRYLLKHAKQLDNRGSSIYAKRSRFSIFGVGDYSFSPAKVAISGLYKNIRFQAVGRSMGKPIMVDDTCYFIPCNSKSEADFFATLLNSEKAQLFLSSLIFRDAKRPVTIDILKRVDLEKLAKQVGKETTAIKYLSTPSVSPHQKELYILE